MKITTGILSIVIAMFSILCSGCGETIYYGTMEKFGYQKRDILVDRIEDANESQKETREQFASALEQFSSVVTVEGDELEAVYKKLSKELEASEDKAEEVHDRIVSVEKVSKDLFIEWEEELEQYTSDSLRENSRRKMEDTKARYEQLITSMKSAESRIDPVLASFRDQVLFLKHNLNAKAIASIRNEIASVETDVARLLKDMDASISEAEAFIKEMNEDEG